MYVATTLAQRLVRPLSWFGFRFRSAGGQEGLVVGQVQEQAAAEPVTQTPIPHPKP